MKSKSIYERALEIRHNIIYDIDVNVHTRHCCKNHGCKYGDDDICTVVTTNHYGMTGDCQSCFDERFQRS